MTTEISKMFENAGIEKDWKPLPYGDIEEYYPDFTAEKQIELIKWLAKIYELRINWVEQYYNSYHFAVRDYKNGRLNHSVCGCEIPFEETLAYLINRIWQDLTEEERTQIKNILESEVRE
jgi:hypothetical protein